MQRPWEESEMKPRQGHIAGGLLPALVLLWPCSSYATDTWTEIAEGVRWLERVADGQTIQVAEIDIATPELSFRVTREDEAPTTTQDFHTEVEALVTINGDWVLSDYYPMPVGLSVGNGWKWTDSEDPPNLPYYGDQWSFFACTTEKACHIDEPMTQWEWRMRWHNVIGGNGDRLLVDGQVTVVGWDSSRRARSALCLDSTGTQLLLIVVQGDGAAGSLGMTPEELAELTADLGCYNAMALDGGGSSNLYIGPYRVNERNPDEPNERSLANHLSVIYRDTVEESCETIPNGNHCESEVLVTCQSGQRETLDCGYYGFSCEEDLGTAYCVDPTCIHGAHDFTCEDETVLGICEYGQKFTIDCAGLWGATCEDNGSTAYCVDARCIYGGEASWCEDDVLKTCSGGLYAEEDCAASGLACIEDSCAQFDSGLVDTEDAHDSGGTGGTSPVAEKDKGCACSSNHPTPGAPAWILLGIAWIRRGRRCPRQAPCNAWPSSPPTQSRP